jgi:hypothetical protein
MDNHNYLLQVATAPNMTWPQRVSMVSQKYGTNASVSAKMLEPYYKTIEDLKWMNTWLMYPDVTTFVNNVAVSVNNNLIT